MAMLKNAWLAFQHPVQKHIEININKQYVASSSPTVPSPKKEERASAPGRAPFQQFHRLDPILEASSNVDPEMTGINHSYQ